MISVISWLSLTIGYGLHRVRKESRGLRWSGQLADLLLSSLCKSAFHHRNREECIRRGWLKEDGTPDLARLRVEKKAEKLRSRLRSCQA